MEVEPKSEQKMNILVVMQRESSHSTVRTIITSPSEKWNCNRSALWEKKKIILINPTMMSQQVFPKNTESVCALGGNSAEEPTEVATACVQVLTTM